MGIVCGILVLFVFVAIQFGYSFYASTQFYAFLILFFFLMLGLVGNNKKIMLPVFFGAFAFFFTQAFYINSPHALQNLLRCSREFVCYLCIIFASCVKFNNIPRLPRFIFLGFSLIILVITTAQSAYLQGIIPYNSFIPSGWFAYETGTVQTDVVETAIAGGYQSYIRPSGFYSEPSYLGFICLCLYVCQHQHQRLKNNLIVFIILLSSCLVARTASGVVLLCIFVYITNAKQLAPNIRSYLGFAIVLGLGTYLSLPYFSRLMESSNDFSEQSGYGRLIFPLKLLRVVFLSTPLGVPFADLPEFIQTNLPQQADYGLDNGIANIFITYGVLGFVIWICLMRAVRDTMLALFVVFCALSNGTIFSYDKAVLLSLVMLAYLKNNSKITPGLDRKKIVKNTRRIMQRHFYREIKT